MAIIKSTDLDFDTIKNSLKEYLKKTESFSDYNFEASGLSSLLDVLAHNTHIQGLIANYGINESFLNSAQLRSSVIAHATALGYNVSSKIASTATVNLTVQTNLTSPAVITLPAYSEFSALVDGVSYNFLTTEDYLGYNNGSGLFTFQTSDQNSAIPLKEGERKTKTFLVSDAEDNQIYVIPDFNCDISTLDTRLYISPTSNVYFTYNSVQDVVRVTNTSRVYIIKEAPNGFFDVTFSDGNVLGISPKAGEKIVINYISTTGEAANGASQFTFNDLINISGNDYTLNVTTVSQSAGGSSKESIQSIKSNAPLTFAAQQRLVTPDDYKALIAERFSSTIDDVASWGGEDNVPAEFGKAFVSLNFKENLTDTVKNNIKGQIITSLSDNLSVMSIKTEIVDPQYSFLELGCTFNFDPDLTGNTVQTIENLIRSKMAEYVNTNLNKFNGVFRRSNLLAQIDDLDPSILNSKMEVKLQQRFVPKLYDDGFFTNADAATLSQNRNSYTIKFPVVISPPDDESLIVISSRFTYNGQDCNIQNKLGSETLRVMNIENEIVVDNIGSYSQASGTVTLTNFGPSAFVGDHVAITIFPANQSTVKPLRNYILRIDSGASFAKAEIDYQNTKVILT